MSETEGLNHIMSTVCHLVSFVYCMHHLSKTQSYLVYKDLQVSTFWFTLPRCAGLHNINQFV